ncbi:MAG: CHASE2 domain-containing protein, partial [Treponema sp.]|nr:CHASE2 domain-containing protein [Treponema sp.]
MLAPLGAFIVSCFLFFSSLDNKIFDLFLRAVPSLTEDELVTVLTLDDDTIAYAGEFPFSREMVADIVVFLKEVGVQTLAFDLSHLDPSPKRLNPDFAPDIFPRYLDSGFGRINDAVDTVIDSFAAGAISPRQTGAVKKEFSSLSDDVRSGLESSLEYMDRDVDGYFAQALGFTGNSWLALTMIGNEHVLAETAAPVLDEKVGLFLKRHIALKNIEARDDRRSPDQVGVMPAIFPLLQKAKGAGFVNANPDRDGYMRRVHLLATYKGDYYGHLALGGMGELLGNPAIRVSNSAITLQDAQLRGVRQDIVIPRSEDGSLLLKWPKKSFHQYRQKSLLEIVQHIIIEKTFAQNLAAMESSNLFYWWDGDKTPLDLYRAAQQLRGADYRFEDWLALREEYIIAAGEFLNNGYEDDILFDIGDDKDSADYVKNLFRVCRDQFSRMEEIRKTAGALKNNFCVIGADATAMTDNGLITFEEDYPNVGTYAVVANMILSGEFLDDAPPSVSLILAIALSFAMALVVRKRDTLRATVMGLLGLVFIVAAFLVFFVITKRYVGLLVPFASASLTFLSLSAFNFFTTSREKSFLHMAFSRYLAPEVINELIADPSRLNLGGEKREMTAMFTDLQGFSTISEQIDPTHLVTLLNVYLTEMSTIIMENRGTIDKYEGDAIMAFFGAPLYREDHAALACRSAIRIKQAERELNKRIIAEQLSPYPLYTRIGVNTGEMIVGNMGAANKMDYTVMGSAVNLASRLEGVNKHYHTRGILISEYTKEKIGDEFLCKKLDRVRVVGISNPVRLYELVGLRREADDGQLEYFADWEKAFRYFEERDFKKALEIFSSLADRHRDDKT